MICRKSDPESASIAADYLRRGKILILPTDTIYGFSGIVDGRHYSFHTEKKIFDIKGRNEEKPLIQLISSPDDIKKYTRDLIPDELLALWPGALTIIVHTYEKGGIIKTTAFRCPGDEWLRNVISICGAPIYSTSVNKTGLPYMGDVNEIKSEFGKVVDLIIEDGDKKGNLPSTVVQITEEGSAKIVRQGSVKIEL